MLEIGTYVKAGSIQEAYELNQKKGSVLLGGMMWLKMQNRRVSTAIDLSGLGLDTIEETPEEYRIGAMVTLRQLERHPGLNQLTQGAVAESVKPIVGVQFRNLATVGGSVYGRFGFSDVLTLFMALNASVELYHRGVVSVEEFAQLPDDRDVLVRLILPKQPQQVVYLSQRNTRTDFPVLTCCIARRGDDLRCCIGARPGRAVCLTDPNGILQGGITPETAKAFGDYVSQTVKTGSNLRGSEAYRRRIAGVLTQRALTQLVER